jgi:hypothetical protein
VVQNRGADLFGRLPAPGGACGNVSPPSVQVDYDEDTSSARVTASIDIPAAPKVVYAVMVDCARALRVVTGLESCRVIEQSADGTWDIREHIVSIGLLLPRIRNVFRSDYERDSRIRFRRLDGDLKVSEGEWRLQPLAGGSATRVHYQSRVGLSLPVPRFLIQEAVRRDIPNVLIALRQESLASAAR